MDLEQVRSETNKTIVELLGTPYSNTTFIERKESIMHTVVDTAAEAHPAPLIALTQTKIMLGKTSEAVELLNRIWEMGENFSSILETLYIFQLNSVGLFSKSLVLLKPKMSLQVEAREDFTGFKQSILKCAVGLGDLELMDKIADLEEFRDEQFMIKTFVEQMDKKMLTQHFKTQQELLNNAVSSKQSGYEVTFDSDDGYPTLDVGIFVGGDSVDRYQLQNDLDDIYSSYYIENNVNPLVNYSFAIYDIKEHWALEE